MCSSLGGLVPAFPAGVMGAGRKRGPPPRRVGGVRAGGFSRHTRGVSRGPVAMATQRPAAWTRERGLRELALQMELVAAVAAAATLFLLLIFIIFASVYVGSGPVHQPLPQNC